MPSIDYQAIRFWIDVTLMLWAFLVSGVVIWDRRNKVTQAAVQALHNDTQEAVQTLRHEVAKELADMRINLDERRHNIDVAITEMRARQADTPTRLDMADLYRAINTVSAVSTELRGTVASLQGTIQMINQHLLDK